MYLHVAFLHHIHAANGCEKFVKFERIFCMNPEREQKVIFCGDVTSLKGNRRVSAVGTSR